MPMLIGLTDAASYDDKIRVQHREYQQPRPQRRARRRRVTWALVPGDNMKMMVVLLALVVCFAPQTIYANDGFAALGVGGVTLSKTDKIAIKSELLDVSCDKINVSYDFVNETNDDEDALIMFPLPPYSAELPETYIISQGQPSEFNIRVNGKEVDFDTQVRAMHEGRDITEELKDAGLTLKQIAEFPFDRALQSVDHEPLIPKEQIDKLKKKGINVPGWDIHVTYVWKQRFPAHAVVHVEHSYRPFIAEGTMGGYPGYAKATDYCLTKNQLRRLDKLHANKKNLDGYNQVPGTNLKYILTTANSWRDSIRDFKLRIHAKSKDEVVGLCFPVEVKKVSDTLYEAQLKQFKPSSDLSVYFGNAKKCGPISYGEPPQFH
jgi:hypothetical protein